MSEKRQLPSQPPADSPGRVPLHRQVVDWLFAPWIPDDVETSRDWYQDAHRAYVEQQPLRARKMLYAVAITFVILVVWAALAMIDEVTWINDVMVLPLKNGADSLYILIADIRPPVRDDRHSQEGKGFRVVGTEQDLPEMSSQLVINVLHQRLPLDRQQPFLLLHPPAGTTSQDDSSCCKRWPGDLLSR